MQEINEIKFKHNEPHSVSTNVQDMSDDWFKEGSEEQFEKAMDRKMITCFHLDWDFFINAKFSFQHVLEQMNCRELYGVETKLYPYLVKPFYVNMRQGLKVMIY